MRRRSRLLARLLALLMAVAAPALAKTPAAKPAAPSKPAAAPAQPATAPAPARDTATLTVADIAACMRSNVVDRGSLRDVELRTVDKKGAAHTLRMKLFWKPQKGASPMRTTLRVVEPELHAGAAYLIIAKPAGDEVYFYMPTTNRVQRVGGDQDRTLFGTDLTQSDVKHVQQLLENGEVQRLADGKVSERAVFVLDTKTDLEATGYTRIVSYVDQQTCTLLKSEFFTSSGDPRKVLEADLSTLVGAAPRWLILGYTMRDLKTGTRTALKLSDVYVVERLPEDLFDSEYFYRASIQ